MLLTFYIAVYLQKISQSHKMMTLLQDYVNFLKDAEVDANSDSRHTKSYHLPSEVVLPEEWTEFDHAYQLHCPNLCLERATRDVSFAVCVCCPVTTYPCR